MLVKDADDDDDVVVAKNIYFPPLPTYLPTPDINADVHSFLYNMIFASTYSSPRQNIFLSFVLLFYRPPTSPLSSSNVVRWMNSMHRGVAVLQLFLPLTFFLQDHLVWPPNAEVHMLLQLLLHPSSFTLWVGDSPSQLGTPLVTVARWQGRDFGTCCMRWCTVLVLEKMDSSILMGWGRFLLRDRWLAFHPLLFTFPARSSSAT